MKTQHALYGLGLILTSSCNPNVNSTENEVTSTQALHDWTDLIPKNYTRIEKFSISNSKESFVTTKTGSKLSIPVSCFVDENGNTIQGEVEIAWEEFHTLGDQILSNVNMMYDSAGVNMPFISGGMFRIDGSHNGNPVFIAKDKKIKVDLLSQSPQENFNFYQQNSNSTQWTYKMNTNSGFDNNFGIRSEFAPKSPSTVVSNESKGHVIDAKPKNIKDFTELNPEEILGWKTPKAIPNEEYFQITSKNSDCTLEPVSSNYYRLVFHFKNEQLSYPVQAFTFDDAAQETAEQKAILKEEKEKIEKRNQQQLEVQKIVRSMEISEFAIYNWDVCGRMTQPTTFYTNFVTTDNTDVENFKFALVCLSQQYQVKFDVKNLSQYQFDATCRNTIIAIDDDGKIYYVKPE